MSQNIIIKSLYIPNTFGLNVDYIKFIFERDYCKIDNIELIGKLNHQSGRVHIKEWYSNIVASNFIQRLINNNYARVIYDDASEAYLNVMINKINNFRKTRLNVSTFVETNNTLPEIKQEETQRENNMLSNADFAAMYKTNDLYHDDDIEFKNACRRLVIEDDEPKITMSLVSEDYAVKLEEVIAQQNQIIDELTRELMRVKKML